MRLQQMRGPGGFIVAQELGSVGIQDSQMSRKVIQAFF